VPADGLGLAPPIPLTGLGRFKHEATCIDPRTGIVYLTEDEGDGEGLFYRFLPNDRARLAAGGRLQALGFRDSRMGGDSRNWTGTAWSVGDGRDTIWIDLDGPENPDGDLHDRGHAQGAAWFARGEGVFFAPDGVYFACTSGGPGRLGQIFRYRPSPEEGRSGEAEAPGRIDLFVESSDPQVMRMADNIAIAPWGHMFACEDKPNGMNFLKAITPQGRIYTVGRNPKAPGDRSTELAGACFSPDGSTLFLNIYWPGTTLAITGPWASVRA
jgi:secreted PhoX family phosphatase